MEVFGALATIGLVLIGAGFIVLIFKLYNTNSTQGLVSELNPVFALFFGMLNWNKNKVPMLMIFGGVIMLLMVFFT